jgi:hypothetical protein
VREIVLRAVADDAPLGGVLAVRGLVQRQLGDASEQRLLLGAVDEILAVLEAVGQRPAAEQVFSRAGRTCTRA